MGNLHSILNHAADAAVQVTKHDPISLPANLIDRVKLTALIDALNALDYALGHSEEAKTLGDDRDERAWFKELSYEYAKAQVDIQMNINALSADVREAA